jgi:hypothetical protein
LLVSACKYTTFFVNPKKESPKALFFFTFFGQSPTKNYK